MKETHGIQTLLKEINDISAIQQVNPLCLAEAFDPPTLRLRLLLLGMHTTELFEERREIVQAYLMLVRSTEEIELLMNDAKNVVTHYSDLRARIGQEMQSLELANDSFS